MFLLRISKTFSHVRHKCFLVKLLTFGCNLALISWSLNFLGKRTIFIQVNMILSQPLPINADVRQGSVPVPVLFSFVVTYLSSNFNPIHSFADYTTICSSLSYRISRHTNPNIDRDR